MKPIDENKCICRIIMNSDLKLKYINNSIINFISRKFGISYNKILYKIKILQ